MAGKNVGRHISFWLSNEQHLKLQKICQASGLRQTEVWRAFLENRQLSDRSFTMTYNLLAKLGGLMKSKLDKGERGAAWKLGQEVLRIAKKLEAGGGSDDADNSGGKN